MEAARFKALLRIFPLLPLALHAQDVVQVLPEGSPPPVEMIRPVPAPEIQLGSVIEEPMLPDNLKIDNRGGTIEGDSEGIRLGGPVKVEGDNGLEIFADRAVVDLKAKSVTFEGAVSVYQGNILQRGDRAVYQYEEGVLNGAGLRVSIDPIILEAGKFTGKSDGNGNTVFIGENAGITTNDVKDPAYWVRSNLTTVYPGEKVTFRNLKVYAGERQVFWLPYLSQPLNADLGYHFTPGARSNWGPFLLNTYGIMLGGEHNPVTNENENAWLLSKWHFDILTTRGVGIGLDLIDTRKENEEEISGLSLYYLNDADPGDSRNGLPREGVNKDRYLFQIKDRKEFDFENDASWRLDTNFTLLSDRYYLEDFLPDVYRTNPAPDNILGLFRRDDSTLFSVFGRFRVNDFYRTDTQSPEIALDQARRPLLGTPLLHEGQTSFSFRGVEAGDFIRKNTLDPLLALMPMGGRVPGLLNQLNGYERTLVERILALQAANPTDPRIASLRAQLLDTGFNRFHTNHSLSLQMTNGEGFSLTPRIGAGYTRYSSVQEPAASDARWMLHGGVEAAMKISKDYGSLKRRTWGMDGLLHIIQPYANWSIVAADELDENYPKIDRLTFTTRPRPLDPSRYTAIDEFDSWNILRLGARNHIVTQRDGQSHEWLYMDTYIDRYFDDPEGSRHWSNLYNDVRWQPLPWLGADLETQLPIVSGGSGFTEISTRVRYMPRNDIEVSMGYRHLNDHPVLRDSSRVELGTYMRLSENWGAGTLHVFEMDDGTLETQQYTLHHDFGDWIFGMGVTHHDNRYQDEFGVIFSLTLKDFPSASLPFGLEAQ